MRRALPAALAALLIALITVLSGALGLMEGRAVTEICVTLLLLSGGFYAVMRSGLNLRLVDSSLIFAQVGALFLLLAFIAYRTTDFGATVMLMYPAVMLAGMLRLKVAQLAWLAGLGVLANLVAIVTVALSSTINFAAVFAHLVALTSVLGLFVCSARYVGRLRSNLTHASHQLEAQREAAAGKARRDELTGAYSRGYLVDVLGREVSRSERSGKPLCIACIDIDRFQELNGILKAIPGESLLARFSAATYAMVRSVDVFGRMGATQFMLIMPETELQKAAIGAERLRAAIEKAAVPGLPPRMNMTGSIGLLCHVKEQSLADFIDKADTIMRYAKATGGNRVMLDEPGKRFDAVAA